MGTEQQSRSNLANRNWRADPRPIQEPANELGDEQLQDEVSEDDA